MAFGDYEDEEQAKRDNAGKLRWSLMPFAQLEPVVQVLELGANKYGDFNWQKHMPLDKILDSASRHLVDLHKGNVNDAESGLPNAAHVICNMLFYLYHCEKTDENQNNHQKQVL
jgi:Domain of unknown function (DUF5664)